MVLPKRLACLLPVLLFLTLRVLSQANPAPLPWTTGVFDADGLDDLLQTIRVVYSQADDPHREASGFFAMPTGRVWLPEASTAGGTFLTAVRSRAPPGP